MVCLIISMKNVNSVKNFSLPVQKEIINIKDNQFSQITEFKKHLTSRKSGHEMSNYYQRNRSDFYFLYTDDFELVIGGNHSHIFSESQGSEFYAWKFSLQFFHPIANQIVGDRAMKSSTWAKKKLYIVGDMRRECENISEANATLKTKSFNAYRDFMLPIMNIITHDEVLKLLEFKLKDPAQFQLYRKKLSLI